VTKQVMPEDTFLCRLALEHGTDKMPRWGHAYTPYYHSLFADRRYLVRKVLEIGIDVGASLRMWRDYFPKADIYALDCDRTKLIDESRIRSRLCDQGNAFHLQEAIQWLGRDFDLILDDGSHQPEHQVLTAILLMPLLAPDVVYIIEDVLHPEVVVSQIPYHSTVVPFDLVRDPYSNLIVMGRSTP
jgi:hypothetical protein